VHCVFISAQAGLGKKPPNHTDDQGEVYE